MKNFKPVEIRSLHVQVFNAIKDRIISGQMTENEKLPSEAQLCEEFQVSRNIIREAIKSLQSIGLLDVSPGKRGTVVCIPDTTLAHELIHMHLKMKGTTIQELFEARSNMEPYIARLAAVRRTADDLSAMHACVEKMSKSQSLNAATELDLDFHDLMVEASKNTVFKIYYMPLLYLQFNLMKKAIELKGPGKAYPSHMKLLDSIESGDADQAERAMRAHIEYALEVLKTAKIEISFF